MGPFEIFLLIIYLLCGCACGLQAATHMYKIGDGVLASIIAFVFVFICWPAFLAATIFKTNFEK